MLNLIIDTDIGNDCDDAAAVALACSYAKCGKANILCFTVNTSDEYAADCIDAIGSVYGCFPEVGVYRGDGFPASKNSYCKKVAERFHTLSGKRREEAVLLMRKKLSQSPDKSVKAVFIGQLNNLRALLESPADEYGEEGVFLYARKVVETVVMGGMFGESETTFEGQPYTAEFNIVVSVEDSKKAISSLPVLTVFLDFNLGVDVLTLGKLVKNAETDPVGYAYQLFCGGDRPSWDILTVMYAVEGENGLFEKSPQGTVTVNDLGQTSIAYHEGGLHSVLASKVDKKELADALERLF